MNQDHIANGPGHDRKVHIPADPLKNDYKKTCDDFRDSERILDKRGFAKAVYNKYCHYSRGQNLPQIMDHFR